jgi:cytochrome P450
MDLITSRVRMDFDWLLSALPYGERWRRGRKLLHSHLHSSAVPAYQHIQLSSARSFVLDLLRTKHDKDVLLGMVRENFGASIIRMTYGIDVKNGEDEYIAVPETILHAISEVAVPGRFYVDLIPIC